MRTVTQAETAKADRELKRLEAEYQRQGRRLEAQHVHGARVLLEKARRLAESWRPFSAN